MVQNLVIQNDQFAPPFHVAPRGLAKGRRTTEKRRACLFRCSGHIANPHNSAGCLPRRSVGFKKPFHGRFYFITTGIRLFPSGVFFLGRRRFL
jgi:hypothetical protein